MSISERRWFRTEWTRPGGGNCSIRCNRPIRPSRAIRCSRTTVPERRCEAVRAKTTFRGSDLDLSLDKSAAEMLRRWDASGSVKAASGRLLTPYFPLTNTLQNVDIAFTTDAVKLKNTQIQSGQSSLELTGEISNLRRVLLGRGQ